ncbi:PREDICTED: survival motor neuron protein [Ceratosolen solmsi marchali]|uniref:Survival motor neuron protein n=1 Tax=Ceratosolen solmsi marchali TaxID=326594 RepID=A0AAJ6YUP0_9HYME|nr:PREDICTED: survival motor neuron protein [Ceratosolen solmsi marchali]
MTEEDNILFVRGNDDSESADVWDDSALIKAYDKAINLAKEEVSKRMGLETKSADIKSKKFQSHKYYNHSEQHKKKWVVGSPCQAVYSEDGEFYEAVIIKVFENSGMCTVKFIGYNNKEKVELSKLIESEGLQKQIAQQKEAASAGQNVNMMDFNEFQKSNGLSYNPMDFDTNETKTLKNMYMPGSSFSNDISTIPPAPPLPPQFMARLPENDADALSSMLMSWYISGFHTGYYHGLKQNQMNRDQRKK